jgi:PAS domain S-box-containing protein
MDNLPSIKPTAAITPEDMSRDAARISAEIASAQHGTDPFAEAVRATRMPMIISNPRLPDNPVVFANEAFCRLTGYERHEIVGRNCRFLQGPETDPDVVRRIRDAVSSAQPIQIDIRNHRKSGEAFWNRLLMAPVYGADGKLAYFFASQVDVTIERERLEGLESHNAALMAEVAGRLRAQQESEARLRFATQAGRLGIWELDLRNWELNASGLFKEIFGRDPNAPFSHDDLIAAIYPDDRDRVLTAKRHAARNGTEYTSEYRIVRPDQKIGWVQVRAQVVRSADGSALRMAGICLDTTDRRNAEILLELSEESLRLATEAAEIGTWDYNLATDTLTWTERTYAMFGVRPEKLLTLKNYFDYLHPDDVDYTREVLAATLDPDIRAPLEFEYRIIRPVTGAVRWISAKGNGVFADGACIRVLGTCIDITEKRLAEERQTFLLGLWDRLRTLSEPREIMDAAVRALGRHLCASRVGYGLIEPDGATVTLSSSYADGVEPLIGSFELAGFGAHNMAAQRGGQTVIWPDIHADPRADQAAWAHLSIRSLVSVPLIRGGRLAATLFVNETAPRNWSADDVALIQDVAARTWDAVERARAETALRTANEGLERQIAERTSALRASEARLRTIFETSYQFQGLIALDGTLLDANATSLAAIECELPDVLGKKYWDTPWFSQTDGASDIIKSALTAVGEGKNFRQEISIDLPTGARSFDVSLRPIFDGGDRVMAIVPEAVETTDRRRAEEALRQAQKMEAVGQLTGGIAHDFNNLLAGIMGSLELLQRRIGSGRIDGVERYTAAAMTSAQRASALTQRLLAFARRQPLDPKLVDSNRLVAGMEDLLRRTLGPGIALEMVLAGGLWTTMSDPNQLESAILNLAINARDAMNNDSAAGGPEGNTVGRLTIETANTYLDDAYARAQGDEVRPGQYVQISVTDTGTGMPADIIEKAFDPFFTTKPTGQGTGLGLSMVYGFVKQSEGHVRIYSEIGQGTTFKIYLPRHRGGSNTDDIDPQETAAETLRAEAGETVLVVDDEATVRMLVTETLEDLGYAAIEAHDGPSGLAILQSDARIDLLVTDVGLPGLNGRQLADAARVKRPHLKILFMTGYAHNAAIGNGAALDAGMEIMTKPFALDDLAKKIRDMIEAG